MIREILIQNSSKELTDTDIKAILKIAEDDIRVNRINFNKLTPAPETVSIALRCMRAYESCLA